MRIPSLRATAMLSAVALVVAVGVLLALGVAGADPVLLVVVGMGAATLAVLTVVAADLRHTHRDLVRLTGGLRRQLVDAQQRGAQMTSWADQQRVELRQIGDVVRREASSVTKASDALRLTAAAARNDLSVTYNQLAALLDLHGLLPLRAPLPATRSWAASPDVLTRLLAEVDVRRPQLVVECGSGVSSIVLGYAVQRAGVGRVVALEHDPVFAEETRANLRAHGLTDVVEVRDAPLRQWPDLGADEQFQWYDTSALEGLRDVGLVFVDGPPGRLGPLARYPAVPALLPLASDNVVFVLDDTIREDEQQVSARWIEEYPDLVVAKRDAEKGMHVITRAR